MMDDVAPSAFPQLPGEIPPPPRRYSPVVRRLLAGAGQTQLMIAAILALVGAAMTAALCWNLPVDLLLALRGVTVPGDLIGVDEPEGDPANPRTTRDYVLHFRYRVAGRDYLGMSYATADLPADSRHLPVEVLPGMPQWARAAGSTASPLGYWSMAFLLFPLTGLGLMESAARAKRRMARAYTNGVPTVGAVVLRSREQAGGRTYRVHLQWAYTVQDRSYTGALTTDQVADLEHLRIGDEVPVLYLPEKPWASVLYLP